MLRGYGVSARAERRSREGAPDVRAELRTGDSVLLECKWEGSLSSLEDQLDERLAAFPESLALIGVLYPDRLRHTVNVEAALETANDLRWWLHGSRGQQLPDRSVRSGSVSDLADNLRALPLELEGSDRVTAAAGVVGYAIEQAARQVSQHARMSRRVADVIAKTDQEKNRAAALRIGCLVLFNALAFQDRLAAINDEVPTVRESWGSGVHGLRDAWLQICDEIDYVPVFELAAGILRYSRRWAGRYALVRHKPIDTGDGGHPAAGGPRPIRATVPHTAHRRQVHGRLLHVRTGCYPADQASCSTTGRATSIGTITSFPPP